MTFALATSRLTGYQFAFFAIQGPAALASGRLERLAKRGGIAGKITAHAATIIFIAVTRPDKALERLQIKPDEVTDVILTHMHSDHVDGADLFPKAKIWIQKEEFAHYAEKTEGPGGGRPGSEPEYIRALVRLNTLERVHLVDGDAWEIIPGVTVYTGGKHTFASQYVGVNTKAGTVVIASDNVYTYENLEKHIPITATLDAKSNLAAQDRMKKIASNPRLIIPRHDPEVFVRFPKPGNGVARLE